MKYGLIQICLQLGAFLMILSSMVSVHFSSVSVSPLPSLRIRNVPPGFSTRRTSCHILHLRECLIDQLVECLALLSGANAAQDRLSHDVAVLVNHVGGRERVQVGGELSGLAI